MRNICLISSWQKLDMQKHVLSLDGTLIGLKAALSRISFFSLLLPQRGSLAYAEK